MIEVSTPVIWLIIIVFIIIFWAYVSAELERRRLRKFVVKLGDPLKKTGILPYHYGLYYAHQYMLAKKRAREYQNVLYDVVQQHLNGRLKEYKFTEYKDVYDYYTKAEYFSRNWVDSPPPALTIEELKNDEKRLAKYLRTYIGADI